MKKAAAILLAGCLTFQMLMGSVVPVNASELFQDGQFTVTDTPPAEESENVLQQEQDETEVFIPEEEQAAQSQGTEQDSVEEPVFQTEEEPAVFADGLPEEAQEGEEVQFSSNASVEDGLGALEILVTSALPFKRNSSVNVQIKQGSSVVKSGTLEITETDADRDGITFTDLADGMYTVELSAAGFATYRQDVAVYKGQTSKIQVYSAQTWADNEVRHPGVIFAGDVTGDGVLNASDKDMMIQAIREWDGKTAQDNVCDLDGDGYITIADLQYMAKNFGKGQILSTVETAVSPASIQAAAAENTSVSGDVSALLTEGSSVALQTANNGVITEDNPVQVDFILPESGKQMDGMVIQAPSVQGDSIVSEISSGIVEITYLDTDGTEQTMNVTVGAASAAMFAAGFGSGTTRSASVTVGADGSLTLNFGGQIAVKKVSIRITGTTTKDQALVNITKVEFLNDMENRIPAPELNIPSGFRTEKAEDQEIIISWKAESNVTGYDVKVSGEVKNNGQQEQTIRVSKNTIDLKSINGGKLLNGKTYHFNVRSVNGDWKSPWSETYTAVPQAVSLPPAPDYVTAKGGYREISVSWGNMDDTESYIVEYKKASDPDYIVASEECTGTSYTISGLEDDTKYQIRVKGVNELGMGPYCNPVEAVTQSNTPQPPKYKLINTSNGTGKVTAHIKSATQKSGSMVNSALDSGTTAWGVVDGDYGSYWYKGDWDDGVVYPSGENKGLIVGFDQYYEIDTFTFAMANDRNGYSGTSVWYWDEKGVRTEVASSLTKLKDSSGYIYYKVKLSEPVKTNKIQLCLTNYYHWIMEVAEIYFYHYDSLENDIMALYEDESHTTLKEDVTETTIDELEERLNTKDSVSGEYHPDYEMLKTELNTAREILKENLSEAVEVNPAITSKKDGHLGFASGLNTWQPLGRVAYAGEKLIVYVGHNTKKTGANADLQLVFTQYHAQSNALSANPVSLKVGRNEIDVPKLHSDSGIEKGGQLYIMYTGNNAGDKYAVRVSGGSKIPVLNLYNVYGEERLQAITEYLTELQEYVQDIGAKHEEIHTGAASESVNMAYDEQSCILNATDIMLDQMMYSVPATQIWNGIQGSSVSAKASSFKTALDAMDDTMNLFYQHKGLSNDAAAKNNGNNSLPSGHLNIRYMRMFAGAFMYAGGNHIGIGWNEVKILGTDDFGWGIAHEIGHNINQSSYAIAEITNNYFAQLLTGDIRYGQDVIYDKVTSGAVGRSDDVFTQLAMYWQLHLSYDSSKDDHQVYDDYNEMFNSLFYARVDTYARNPGKAPNGLTLGNNAEQNIIRLSCAAANKNLLEFFERWGLIADSTTKAYAEKFEKEERALYYGDNSTRDYRIDNQSAESALSVKGQDVVTATTSVTEGRANEVSVSITANSHTSSILGYEIIRVMTSNGKQEETVVGFAPYSGITTVFTDTVSTVNNRVMAYKVRAVDKFLYYSNTADAGSQKIETKGNHDKSQWTVTTNMVSQDDTVIVPDINNPDTGFNPSQDSVKKNQTINRIIDNQTSTVYNGKASGSGEIIIDMHQTLPATSLIYYGNAISNMKVYVSTDQSKWTDVKQGGIKVEDGDTIWFDSVETQDRDKWVGTYDVRYVKLVVPSGTVSISEVEICGPSGDNLEFLKAGDKASIGILKEAYSLGSDTEGQEQFIPAGSLIITGTYKGNPAYNVVMVYDQEGNVLGAYENETEVGVKAEQVIFAPDPENGNLGEVSDGTWVYYLEPGNWSEDSLPKQIRAELYRVDSALDNAGERVVSDTELIDIPEQLQEISLAN